MATVELGENETFDAEMIFHIDYKILNEIVKDEVEKAVANIKERIDQYLTTHIRAQ